MSLEQNLNNLYQQIAQQVNDIIPVDWTNFYFNGEVKNGDGGVFFFFTPNGGNQDVIYSHYIPQKYDIDKRLYYKELHDLFELTVQLQQVFIENDQESWFSVTMLVNSLGKLKAHFDYTNWEDSEFGPAARIKYFEYKYINGQKINQKDLELLEKMKEYLKYLRYLLCDRYLNNYKRIK